MFCLLGMAWTWARARGYIEDRELRLPPIAVPKSRRPRLDYDEAVAIADRQHVAWRRVAILMMAVLGARRGEICDLIWDRVDLAGRWVELDGKTGPRRVPLPDHLVVELSRLPRVSTYVLGVVPSTARRGLASVLKGVGTHALRRGAVDRLARSGVDVGTAAKLLGHSPTMMLEVYREVSDVDLRAAVDTLASRKVLPLRRR
jgi:integrase